MDIKYIESKEQNKMYEALKLWNEDLGFIFPIAKDVFNYSVIDYKFYDCVFAYLNDEMVGFIILKYFENSSDMPPLDSYLGRASISMLFVKKKYRRNKIGTKLVQFALDKFKGKLLSVGRDLRNFFPAIPNDFDNIADRFFEHLGFNLYGYTHDLVCKDVFKKDYLDIRNKDVKYSYIKVEEKEELYKFIERNGWSRWLYEAHDYLDNVKENKKFVIGKLDDKIVSYGVVSKDDCYLGAYNMMWKGRFEKLGGIGPLGVDKDLRKQGLGHDIIAYSFNLLKEYGVSDIMIDWTGLMELYRRYGFEVWKAYRYCDINA